MSGIRVPAARRALAAAGSTKSMRRGLALTGFMALVSLGACRPAGPGQVRSDAVQPVAMFANSPDAPGESRGDGPRLDPVRRDGHGRPIYFRDVPLDRHRAAGCGSPRCASRDDRQRQDGED